MYKWNPKDDGKTHINVYSKGKTDVGRWASNFQESPFLHPKYGSFRSVEGLWYWLSVPADHPRREELRRAVGAEAKSLGRDLRGSDWVYSQGFEDDIRLALRAKYEAHPDQLALFRETTLPLAHYYVMYGKTKYVHDAEWILQELDNIRSGV